MSEGTGRRPPRKRRPKKLQWSSVWREASALIWARRGRLAIGMSLMVVNPSPASCCPRPRSPDRSGRRPSRADLLVPLAAAGARQRSCGRHRLRPGADPRPRRPALDHRYAPLDRGARRTAADQLLRLDEDRRSHLAHHVGRRRHPESGRHRSRRSRRRHRHRRRGARRTVLAQLAPDDGDAASPRRVRRREGAGVLTVAADLPRARQDQRRRHGTAHGNPGRHPSSRRTPPRSARRWCSRKACTGCTRTSPRR